MKISDWSVDRIMQLPDHCFGRRYWVGVYSGGTGGVANYTICQEQLPDRFIVWSILFANNSPGMTQAMRLTVRLGDRVPANVAEVLTFEKLCKGISTPSIVYEFYCQPNCVTLIHDLRMFIISEGRRIAVLTNGDQQNVYESTVGVLISSIPREVPDWLISEKVKGLW